LVVWNGIAPAEKSRASRPLAPLSVSHSDPPSVLALCRRIAWLFYCFLPVLVLAPLALMLRGEFLDQHFWPSIHLAVVRARSAAVIKLAQWASVRRDMFPPALCRELAALQDQAPMHDEEHTLRETSVVPGLEMTLCPVASGAIAQVYKGVYGGRQVAVKVRHPDVVNMMHLDFDLLLRFASLVDVLPGCAWLRLNRALEQFKLVMEPQTDLRVEAQNLDRFRENFACKKEWVKFPEVLFRSASVLVESFEPGELMGTFARNWGDTAPKATPDEAAFIITRGEDVYLQMILGDNFIHGDLHPGNILFIRNPLQVSILDAGLTTSMTTEERCTYVGVLQAMGDGNGRRAGELMLRFSVNQQCPDPAKYLVAMEQFFATDCLGYGKGIDIDHVVRGLLTLAYRHNVTIDGSYACVIANMLCLQGLVKDLNPNFNILDSGYPYFRAHQVLGDERCQRYFGTLVRWAPMLFWRGVYSFNWYSGLHGDRLFSCFGAL